MLRQLWQKFIPIFAVFSLRSAFPWIMLIVGLIAAIFGFSSLIDGCPNWQEICKWISNILIVSVIIGFISSYFQYKGIYQKNLFDVIYGKEFLKKRNDIDSIWSNVSEVLFKSRFPEISDKIFDVIKRYYIEGKEYYYSDYVITLVISWDDREAGIISIDERVGFRLVKEDVGEVILQNDYTYENKEINGKNIKITNYDIVSYCVNGECQMSECSKVQSDKLIQMELLLKGCSNYDISRHVKCTQNINYDCNLGFRAKTIINNLRLEVVNKIWEEYEINFMPRGVLENYKIREITSDYSIYEYNNLLLTKQGFILTFIKRT